MGQRLELAYHRLLAPMLLLSTKRQVLNRVIEELRPQGNLLPTSTEGWVLQPRKPRINKMYQVALAKLQEASLEREALSSLTVDSDPRNFTVLRALVKRQENFQDLIRRGMAMSEFPAQSPSNPSMITQDPTRRTPNCPPAKSMAV